jgi:hypothetical protein
LKGFPPDRRAGRRSRSLQPPQTHTLILKCAPSAPSRNARPLRLRAPPELDAGKAYAFYHDTTGLACVVCFRHELFESPRRAEVAPAGFLDPVTAEQA